MTIFGLRRDAAELAHALSTVSLALHYLPVDANLTVFNLWISERCLWACSCSLHRVTGLTLPPVDANAMLFFIIALWLCWGFGEEE